jgi:hypothetical protein
MTTEDQVVGRVGTAFAKRGPVIILGPLRHAAAIVASASGSSGDLEFFLVAQVPAPGLSEEFLVLRNVFKKARQFQQVPLFEPRFDQPIQLEKVTR